MADWTDPNVSPGAGYYYNNYYGMWLETSEYSQQKAVLGVAKAWQDSYDYYIKQGQSPEVAKAYADRDTNLYIRNNNLDSTISGATPATGTFGAAKDVAPKVTLSGESFRKSYADYVTGYKQQEAVKEAKKMMMSSIPMNKGQKKFADQTKPGQKKNQWGWWS